MCTVKRSSNWITLVSLAICSVLLIGCGPAKAPAKKRAPLAANFADGVDKAQKVADEIKAAFDAGTPHDADGAMHTGLELLPALPGMAAGEGKLDSDALATVKSACKSAVEQLLILHEGFHPHPGDEGDAHTHDNASVLEALDKAVADLKSATGGVTE